jgi:prepilin-type N-terminal cleavage/methylation domain-containing protein
MTMHTHTRPSRAFTLAEILVVVVILGIASAIVIPQIGNRDDLKAASATRVLMADLMYAQNLSIATQTKHFVRFDPSGTPQTIAVYDNTALATPITHPVQKSSYVRQFAKSGPLDIPEVKLDTVTITAAGKSGNAIGFTALGEPVLLDSMGIVTEIDGNATITVIAGTYKQSIVLQPLTGEISVTTP